MVISSIYEFYRILHLWNICLTTFHGVYTFGKFVLHVLNCFGHVFEFFVCPIVILGHSVWLFHYPWFGLCLFWTHWISFLSLWHVHSMAVICMSSCWVALIWIWFSWLEWAGVRTGRMCLTAWRNGHLCGCKKSQCWDILHIAQISNLYVQNALKKFINISFLV